MSPTPEMRQWRRKTYYACTLTCLAVALLVAGGTYWFYVRATNRTTCVSRVIMERLKASSEQAAHDKTTSPSQRARASATAKFEGTLLNALHPVPRSTT